MAKKEENNSHYDKRTELAEKRTEMAYERTVLAYFRSAATLILFGIAFVEYSKADKGFLFYAGILSIAAGIFLGLVAIWRSSKHLREIKTIKDYFITKIIHGWNNNR